MNRLGRTPDSKRPCSSNQGTPSGFNSLRVWGGTLYPSSCHPMSSSQSPTEADDSVEQTLHIARSVTVYRVPTRGPSGHVSGEWRVGDKLFEGRAKILSKGELCEVRFEDAATGALFAVSPIPYGKRTVFVEAAVDSSRNFVIRVEDAATKQHAFLGISFAERSDSFDFNEALQRHEKHVERDRAAAAFSGAGVSGSSSQGQAQAASTSGHVAQEVQALYANNTDYSLHEGQTIKVNIQKRAPKAGGLMSSAAAGAFSLSVPLPPPPTR